MNTQKISGFFGLLVDFLFPASDSAKSFENVSVEEWLRLLPKSETIKEDAGGNGRDSALFAYKDERVKHLIWEIKYHRNQKIADIAGMLLADKIRKNLAGESADRFFLTPIPLTEKRLRERGFNHTGFIAKSVLKNLPENFCLAENILTKIRHTQKQNSIETRDDRFKNIAGAFGVPEPKSARGKDILLIDDVITTGATVGEAKRVLLSAGAKSVRAFAVGH